MSLVLSIFLLSVWCDLSLGSTDSCQENRDVWFSSWNDFQNSSSILSFAPCDNIESKCAHSSQMICDSKWRLKFSADSQLVSEWRAAAFVDEMYIYTANVSRESITAGGRVSIEHTYLYACGESSKESLNESDTSTVCSTNETYWQIIRKITVFVPTTQLEISTGSEITEGETVRLSCSTNLPSSSNILMVFKHKQQVAYCRPFQENPEYHYNGWKVYRTLNTENSCVLEVENVTATDTGEYLCFGFLPDGSFEEIQPPSSVAVNAQGTVLGTEADDFNVLSHIVGLWITVGVLVLFLLVLVIFAVVAVVIRSRMKQISSQDRTRDIDPTDHDYPRPTDESDIVKSRTHSTANESVFLQSQIRGHRLNSDSVKVNDLIKETLI